MNDALQLPVYLDYNATTPCDPQVLAAMLPYFTRQFGNAASKSHVFGWQADEAVQIAREQLAEGLGADPTEIVFTGSATESVNLAVKGVFEQYAGKGKHLITVATEHKAVLDSCRHLEKMGAEITRLSVAADGQLDLNALEAAIRPDTLLIAVMYANNETGVIQPIAAIGELAHSRGVLFFSDATQAMGKLPVRVQEEQIDLLAFSAHKFYGPKGVGGLYIRRRNPRVKLIAQLDGGGQERGLRSGTLNVPGIVGMGKAFSLAVQNREAENRRLAFLRDKLEKGLVKHAQAQINGSIEHRLPQVTNLCFPDADASLMMKSLSTELAISSGSACTSATPEASHVLLAMGIGEAAALGSIRFSLGRYTTEAEIDFALDCLSRKTRYSRT